MNLGGVTSTGRFGGFIKISRTGIRALGKASGGDARKREVREAVREAIKSAKDLRIRDYAVSKIATETGLEARVIRAASRIRVGTHRDRLTVWFGLNPIGLNKMRPKQTKEGVSAGPARVPGGFIVKKIARNVFVRKGRSRLPIVKQTYDIRDKGETAALKVYNYLLESFQITLGRHIDHIFRTRGLS